MSGSPGRHTAASTCRPGWAARNGRPSGSAGGRGWPSRAWPRLALPLFGLGGFQFQVGIDSLVIALLAVGLNIMVGWTGLLDLGYVAFFGFGAYGFALVSSGQIGAMASTCRDLSCRW